MEARNPEAAVEHVRSFSYESRDSGEAKPNLAKMNGPAKWIANDASTSCLVCNKYFGVFRRRHHCRSCGTLACSSCTRYQDFVPGYRDMYVRVCVPC